MSKSDYTAQTVIVGGVGSDDGAPVARQVNRLEKPASELACDLPARRRDA
ncbi:hypothetical protein ACIBCU_23025 [Streptomyces sp. NPDC051064]